MRRLVTSGVAWRQADRPDFGEVYRELRLLDLAVRDKSKVDSPDFWAEELLCGTRGETGYRYYADRQQYVARLISGMEVGIGADLAANSLRLQITYAARGDEDRRHVIKFLEGRVPEAVETLAKVGFKFQKGGDTIWSESYSIRAAIEAGVVQNNSDKLIKALKKVIDRLALN